MQPLRRIWGVEVQLHSFVFTSVLGGDRWLTSRPGRFNPGIH